MCKKILLLMDLCRVYFLSDWVTKIKYYLIIFMQSCDNPFCKQYINYYQSNILTKMLANDTYKL